MKKRPKNLSNYFLYFFVFLFCIALTGLFSCSNIAKKTEKLASGIPFNYPGLRIETRTISIKEMINDKNPRIVCFGDSVTFGWNVKYGSSYPFMLEKKLSDKYPGLKVINSGIGGNTIIDASERFKKDVLSYKPHLVVINFGLNDGMLQKSGAKDAPGDSLYYNEGSSYFLPRVSIADYEIRYKEILNTIVDNEISVLILGLSPVTQDFPLSYKPDFQKKQKDIYSVYNERIRKIASENNLDFLDIWQIYDANGDYGKYIQADAIHPNEAGLELITESILSYILENNVLIYNK